MHAMAGDSIRVLFIGNSLTYTNDLPMLVRQLAEMDSVAADITCICKPDYSLEDHFHDGTVQAAIASGRYTAVVAQQGPSALPGSQALLLAAAEKLGGLCRRYGARLCLYAVWPSADRAFDRVGVATAYRRAAAAAGSLLAPVGTAMEMVGKKDPALGLLGPDGFHPSFAGSVLAAFTIYATLQTLKEREIRAPQSWQDRISASSLRLLAQTAVQAVNARNR